MILAVSQFGSLLFCFDFVGIESVGHLFFGSIVYLDDEAYKGMVKQVEE